MSVDLSSSIYKLYNDARKKADAARAAEQFGKAALLYKRAAHWMKKFAEYTHDSAIRKERIERSRSLLKLSIELGEQESKVGIPISDIPTATSRENLSRESTDSDNGFDDYEEEVLGLIEKSDVTWGEIGGLEDTKESIKMAYALAMAQSPAGVQVKSWRNLLLFGPPGTGKTLLAAATAGNLEATFFNVKVSSLLSKYFGESTKLISALYSVANKLNPAVIFLDEFESLTPVRGSGESGAERRIVSTLLAELDGLKAKSQDGFVLTLCSTNLPWLLDLAILSRFQRRIYVPLPDEAARKAILEIHLKNRGFKMQPALKDVIEKTDGYSGREIEQVCQIAIHNMIQRVNPGLTAIVDQGLDNLRNYQMQVEPISHEDFTSAYDLVQPIADAELLRRYDNWQKKVDL